MQSYPCQYSIILSLAAAGAKVLLTTAECVAAPKAAALLARGVHSGPDQFHVFHIGRDDKCDSHSAPRHLEVDEHVAAMNICEQAIILIAQINIKVESHFAASGDECRQRAHRCVSYGTLTEFGGVDQEQANAISTATKRMCLHRQCAQPCTWHLIQSSVQCAHQNPVPRNPGQP